MHWTPLLFLAPAFAFPTLFTFPPRHARNSLMTRQNIDTGSCGSTEIKFVVGTSQGTSFEPVNRVDFDHGQSREISQIALLICNRLKSPCNAPQSTLDLCKTASGSVGSQTSASAADLWNSQFGIPSNYAGNNNNNNGQVQATTTSQARQAATSTQAAQNQQSTQANNEQKSVADDSFSTQAVGDGTFITVPAGQGATNGVATGTITAPANAATATQTSSSGSNIPGEDDLDFVQCALLPVLVTYTIAAPGAVQTNVSGNQDGNTGSDGTTGDGSSDSSDKNTTTDNGVSISETMSFGTCTDPTVQVGFGLNGRGANELVFINNNVSQFPHGSALEIRTITEFTCNNLVNKCGLKTDNMVFNACQVARMVADTYGNTGYAADVFNGALGFKSNYASVDGSW